MPSGDLRVHPRPSARLPASPGCGARSAALFGGEDQIALQQAPAMEGPQHRLLRPSVTPRTRVWFHPACTSTYPGRLGSPTDYDASPPEGGGLASHQVGRRVVGDGSPPGHE